MCHTLALTRWTRRPARRLLGSCAVALAAANVLGGCATIDSDDLSGYVEQLHSDAALGELVAGQAAAGRSPYIFTWLQSAELLHHVGELQDKFSGETANPGLGAQVQAASTVAARISAGLGQLHGDAKSASVAAEVQASLKSEATRAEDLYKELS